MGVEFMVSITNRRLNKVDRQQNSGKYNSW